jgi:hypothetical protein
MLCANGHDNADGAQFCAVCGASLQTGLGSSASAPAGSDKNNSLAVASLVLGILGFIPLLGIVAIVLGAVARRQINERGQKGAQMALIGIVAAVAWLVVSFLVVVGHH